MRLLTATALAACLSVGPALAQANPGSSPLPPGKPAGVSKAQSGDNTVLYILGAGAIIAGIVLVATNNGNGSSNNNNGGASSSGSNP